MADEDRNGSPQGAAGFSRVDLREQKYWRNKPNDLLDPPMTIAEYEALHDLITKAHKERDFHLNNRISLELLAANQQWRLRALSLAFIAVSATLIAVSTASVWTTYVR